MTFDILACVCIVVEKTFKRGTNTPRMVLGLWAATEN